MKKIEVWFLSVWILGVFSFLLITTPAVAAQPAAGPASPISTVKTTEKAAAGTAAYSVGAWNSLVEQAKKEGTAVIYSGPMGAARTALMDAFRQKYGISLDIIVGRGEEMVAKMTTERNAGIYAVDMGMHGMTTFFNSIKPRGMTVPIKPLLMLPEVVDTSKWRQRKLPVGDKEGHLVVLGVNSLPHMLVNNQMVRPGDITTHTDLLDPKWRGKIAINDPSFSGAGNEWFTFLLREMMGVDKGTAFMKQLVKQGPAILRDQRLLTEWVARGKFAIALGPQKATTAEFILAGAPLSYPQLKDPMPTGSGPGNIMVFDKIPHPNATKLFINWLLSKEGSTVYSKASGYASTRMDVPTDWIEPIVVPGPNDTILGEDYQLGKDEMMKLAGEIFRELIK